MDRGAWGATVHGVVESDMTEVTGRTHTHNDWLLFQIHLPRSCQPEIWEPHRVTTDLGFPGYFVHIQVRRSLPSIMWNILNATELPT